MNKIHRTCLAVLITALAVTSAVITTCDMTYIPKVSPKSAKPGDKGGPTISQDDLERTGHFLKLLHMPLHTQSANVASVQVANAASSIARLNQDQNVQIFKDNEDTCTVYLPLVYNDDSEFTENGSFFVAFAIHVDAITSYVVDLADKILVPFADGRGVLDVRTIPVFGPGNNSPDLTENERDELERTGHFLKLLNMPLHTQGANVTAVQIANSVSSIAGLDRDQNVRIFRDAEYADVYLPLAYFNNVEFTETGSFYVTFAVHVDAVTSYVVTVTDKILVPFSDGRGELDVRMLPHGGFVAGDRRYLTIYNLPLHMLPQNVSNVFVNNRYGPVAFCDDYSLVEVSAFGGSSTVSIPLSFVNSKQTFAGTGSYYVAFDLFADALTHYTAAANDHVLVYFLDGNGYMDINDLANAMSADRRYLTITNLPSNLLAQNVTNVTIRNQAGAVAQCEDYHLLNVSVQDGKAAVRIPLVFINPPSVFTGTGDFIVTFNINIDARTSYVVAAADDVLVTFTDGNGALNIDDIPIVPPPDRRYFTINNLPSNLLSQNVSNVTIHNQTDTVAVCEDYNALIVSLSGGKASVRIPLVFAGQPAMFTGTGNFIVAFDINIDAQTGFIVEVEDNVRVSFVNGNGSLNINDVPAAQPQEHRYLTISGLPPNLLKQNITNVLVHNLAGPIAQCENYNLLSIDGTSATAWVRIPLVFTSPRSMFTGTGKYFVSFSIVVDAVTSYVVSPEDKFEVTFTNGNGEFNVNNLPKKKVNLTLTGLPYNTIKQNITNVNVYSLAGVVASAEDGDIEVVNSGATKIAYITLSNAEGYGYFEGTGEYVITYSIIIDYYETYETRKTDELVLKFTNGVAEYNVTENLGKFEAVLTNADSSAKPIIQAGAKIDIKGFLYRTTSDTPITVSTPSGYSGILYLYVYKSGSEVSFEFSSQTPALTPTNGADSMYYGSKRALWKMIYVAGKDLYLFKRKVNENFFQLDYYSDISSAEYTALTQNGTSVKEISGSGSPPPETVTLQPGVYIAYLKGAAGGSGSGGNSDASPAFNGKGGTGGAGGSIIEIFTLNTPTSFTAFTGSGGAGGGKPSVTSYKRYPYIFAFANEVRSNSQEVITTNTVLTIPCDHTDNFYYQAGGGGSGTFLYNQGQGYLLCAGGGGGGSGASYLIPGGGGGSGGAVGPGAGGGAAGYLLQFHNGTTYALLTDGHGGSGGGYQAGSGGVCSSTGASGGNNGVPSSLPATFHGQSCNAAINLSLNATSSGGNGATSYNDQHPGTNNPTSFCPPNEFITNIGPSNNRHNAYYYIPTYYFSASSGSGGSAPKLDNVNGAGAHAQALEGISFSPDNTGTVTVNQINVSPTQLYTSYTTTSYNDTCGQITPHGKDGVKGSDGGNNRTSTRGGGASPISGMLGNSGSLTIYKLY